MRERDRERDRQADKDREREREGGGVIQQKLGQLVGKSAGLVIKKLRVQILAEVVGEFSSPELILCADSF